MPWFAFVISLFFLSQSQSVLFRDHEQYTCKVVSSIPYTRGNTTCEFTAGCAKHRLLTALVAGYLVCNFAPFSNQQPEANKEKKNRCHSSPFGTRITCSISKGKKRYMHGVNRTIFLGSSRLLNSKQEGVTAVADRKRRGTF